MTGLAVNHCRTCNAYGWHVRNCPAAAEVTRLWRTVTGGLVREGEAAIAAALDAAAARGRAELATEVEALVESFDIAQPCIASQLRALIAEAIQ